MKQNAILFLCSVVLLSCTQKALPPNWTAAMCNPYGYRIYAPHIDYFYKGKKINSVESLFSIGMGDWGYPQPGRSMGDEYIWPDSVHVSYRGFNDKLEIWKYEGGGRLPSDTIRQLFERGYDWDGEHWDYVYLTTGMAPGGRVCVWADHVELTRFKVSPISLWRPAPVCYTTDSIIEEVYARFLDDNPINPEIWDCPENRYDMEFYFCSENLNSSYHSSNFISQEGTFVFIHEHMNEYGCNSETIPFSSYRGSGGCQQLRHALTRDHLLPFPSVFTLSWKMDQHIYCTSIPFKRLKALYTTPYLEPKTRKKVRYRRILFKVVEDATACEVYLVGPGRQTRVIYFKALDALIDSRDIVNPGGTAKDIQWFLPDKAE